MASGQWTGSMVGNRSAEASAGLTASQPPGTSALRRRTTVARRTSSVKYMRTLRQRVRATAVERTEIRRAQVFRRLPQRPFAVSPQPGRLQRARVDVGGQQGHGPIGAIGERAFEQEDRK